MNSYSHKSKQHLLECHVDLQVLFAFVLQTADHTVLEGYRSLQRQREKFLAAESKVQQGKHNTIPSMAVDVSPYPIPVNWGAGSRDEYEKFRYFAFYVLGVADMLKATGQIKNDVRWGGDWDGDHDVTDQTFHDLVHFELAEV
ncbi:MAG: hypothetical protein JKX81_13670 [Arenicella sp.]|nr:hypothetical protein [Arenicella sp.]